MYILIMQLCITFLFTQVICFSWWNCAMPSISNVDLAKLTVFYNLEISYWIVFIFQLNILFAPIQFQLEMGYVCLHNIIWCLCDISDIRQSVTLTCFAQVLPRMWWWCDITKCCSNACGTVDVGCIVCMIHSSKVYWNLGAFLLHK